MAALQLLTPYQRAVLILRDVLDWPTGEVADILEQTVPSVKSALYRARIILGEEGPGLRSETMKVDVSDAKTRAMLDRYMQAWETANVNEFIALLREDCTFSMPPIPSWYQGRASIRALVHRTVFSGQAEGL